MNVSWSCLQKISSTVFLRHGVLHSHTAKSLLDDSKQTTQSPTHQIDDDWIPKEQWETKQDPRKIRSLEREEAKEVHADVWIAPAPDVHQHDGEGLAEKHQAHKHCDNLMTMPVNENNSHHWTAYILHHCLPWFKVLIIEVLTVRVSMTVNHTSSERERERERVFICQNTNTMLSYNTTHCAIVMAQQHLTTTKLLQLQSTEQKVEISTKYRKCNIILRIIFG